MHTGQSDNGLERLVVLIADSNHHSRRLTRMMVALDGAAALIGIRELNPDVMIIDWDLPGLSAPEVMRIVRSPGCFPKANLPVIVLTEAADRSRVDLALKLGVHEFLVKPASPKSLQQRLIGITNKPRPMVLAGGYKVPLPRNRVDRNELLSAPAARLETSLGAQHASTCNSGAGDILLEPGAGL
jgi:two-component system chemotaxis response regulator CheY